MRKLFCRMFGHSWQLIVFWPGWAYSSTNTRTRRCRCCGVEVTDTISYPRQSF